MYVRHIMDFKKSGSFETPENCDRTGNILNFYFMVEYDIFEYFLINLRRYFVYSTLNIGSELCNACS